MQSTPRSLSPRLRPATSSRKSTAASTSSWAPAAGGFNARTSCGRRQCRMFSKSFASSRPASWRRAHVHAARLSTTPFNSRPCATCIRRRRRPMSAALCGVSRTLPS
eukprot:990877-Pleurochrysis_carterae.AAC.1